jgi:hypothetical protein
MGQLGSQCLDALVGSGRASYDFVSFLSVGAIAAAIGAADRSAKWTCPAEREARRRRIPAAAGARALVRRCAELAADDRSVENRRHNRALLGNEGLFDRAASWLSCRRPAIRSGSLQPPEGE